IRLGRRHEIARVRRRDPPVELALFRLTGNEYPLLRFFSGRSVDSVNHIKAEPGFPRFFVGAMTLETTVREERANMEIEVDLPGRSARAPARKEEGGKKGKSRRRWRQPVARRPNQVVMERFSHENASLLSAGDPLKGEMTIKKT